LITVVVSLRAWSWRHNGRDHFFGGVTVGSLAVEWFLTGVLVGVSGLVAVVAGYRVYRLFAGASR
jgi:hypothetical protein